MLNANILLVIYDSVFLCSIEYVYISFYGLLFVFFIVKISVFDIFELIFFTYNTLIIIVFTF